MNRILRIGIFTAVGVFAIVAFSIYVNDHPYWYRSCNEVKIHVDDATGLRRKSPVKTLGLEIGYINAVDLDGDRVLVRVCVTGPVRLNAETRAYIRSAGFLGDKFLELKPVDKIGASAPSTAAPAASPPPATTTPDQPPPSSSAGEEIEIQKNSDREVETVPSAGNSLLRMMQLASDWVIPSARAEEPTLNASREAELQDTMKKVAKLIDQLTLMVGDLREVTQQKDFKETIVNLNGAMKHLEGLLRPTGKVMKNVDSAMESLKNTMASAEAVMNKIKEGEGSVGKFINDPALYDDIRAAIQSINLLLGKAGLLRTYVDIGGWRIPAYNNGTKGFLKLTIAPNPGRYYLIGISTDPRGRDRKTTTTTTVNGGSPTVVVENKNEESGLKITAMFGKYFGPLDLSVGLIEDYGAVGIGFWLDPARRYGVKAEVYSQGQGKPMTARVYGRATLFASFYVTAGIDQFPKYTDSRGKAERAYFFGAGLFFDDDDLKYLLAFK
ncbi:MAG TPA: MlaD family protein [Bdellovibrionota bacterium]|jgi:phospholipid/cholesterol/gamma-HCH transport system substrate-binding protein